MRQNMREIVFGAVAFLSVSPAAALDCSPLAPLPPKDTNVTFNGKIDAAVDGLFAKLASVGAKVEGRYEEVSKTVLKEFPNADKVYMWERVIFLQCQIISESNDISGQEKLKSVTELYQKFQSPPPENGSVINNSGDKVNIQQGAGNTMTIK
jgi:hypothetical protein